MTYLLVTGSRNWRDEQTVLDALHQAHDRLVTPGGHPTLLNGGAAGADLIAKRIWEDKGLPEQTIRANWGADCIPGRCEPGHRRTNGFGSFCPAAGMYRNEQMVALGPRLCLAFLMPCDKPRCPKRGKHDSHGATQCLELARDVGATVWLYRA